jgi:hypothetical protein
MGSKKERAVSLCCILKKTNKKQSREKHGV